MSILVIAAMILFSCNTNEPEIQINTTPVMIEYETLPIRPGTRPETTTSIPHVQIDVEPVPHVHEEMVRRVYSISGIEDQPSVILSWQGLWVREDLPLANPEALISGREFGHIHDDGSLHIFLEPQRAIEAIEAGWAVSHPFAVSGQEGWEGFVMLYPPIY